MKPPDREPTSDELVAMAYADDELDEQARSTFEERLGKEPALARQIAEYRAIELMARETAPPEPADHEWARLAVDPLHVSGSQLGWFLFTAGAIGLAIWFVVAVIGSEMEAAPKGLLLALIAGTTLLLMMAVRARLRLLPYDPYRRVKR